MVDGSMGLNLMMAGQRFSRRGLLGVAWGCLVARAESCMSCQPAAKGARTQAIGRDG